MLALGLERGLERGVGRERLREAICGLRLAHGAAAAGSHVTLSIGVATASPEDENEDACVLKADQMLYEAKRAGRNRVICFGQ